MLKYISIVRNKPIVALKKDQTMFIVSSRYQYIKNLNKIFKYFCGVDECFCFMKNVYNSVIK